MKSRPAQRGGAAALGVRGAYVPHVERGGEAISMLAPKKLHRGEPGTPRLSWSGKEVRPSTAVDLRGLSGDQRTWRR